MRLYYFTTEYFGLVSIRDRRLKIARIQELNDPFEFVAFQTGDKRHRRDLRRWRRERSQEFGLLCMSAAWQHPLMWGHYADKHKGICLGFDVDDGQFFNPITYTPDRPNWPSPDQDANVVNDALITAAVFTKYDGWEYEAEYRALCRLEEEEFDPVTGFYFSRFHPGMQLAQVIVGERSTVSRGRLAQVLGAEYADITSFKARAGFRRFQVEKNRNAKLWR